MYEEGSLTEEEAYQIIGDKMNVRIEVINEWLTQYGYHLLFHSTYKSNVDGILSPEGLHYPKYHSVDSMDEILNDCNIAKKLLIALENWCISHNHDGKLNKEYETNPPVECDTVTPVRKLSAKKLLEYNHLGGDVTVVFCVPNKGNKKIGLPSSSRLGFTQHCDPFLRRRIKGHLCKDKTVEFRSEYFYPVEGILFVYDRKNNKIKANPAFNEEYFLDGTTPQLGIVKKGDLFRKLNEAMDELKNGFNRRRK